MKAKVIKTSSIWEMEEKLNRLLNDEWELINGTYENGFYIAFLIKEEYQNPSMRKIK